RKNAELSQANELKTAFIQVASHELRTPLAIAIGFAELALRLKDVPQPLNDWVHRSHHALKRLSQLIAQITSMLQAGQFEQHLNLEEVDLAKLIREAVDDIRPFVETRKQELILNVPDSLGTMSLDPEKIHDCINHVALNAVKFTPDGGTITV